MPSSEVHPGKPAPQHTPYIIVGVGQAGLSVAYQLTSEII